MNEMRKNMHLPDEVVRLVGDVLHQARFRSETQAVIAMLEGASDRLKEAGGYVYLMRGEKGLKIGTSIQPHARAKALKSQLLHCIPGDRLTELAVHMIWGRYRLTGEWFSDVDEIAQWFAKHESLVSPDSISDAGPVAHFAAFSMTHDMQRRVNEWCARNADPDTGKVPSFSEGCRQLIDAGLSDED